MVAWDGHQCGIYAFQTGFIVVSQAFVIISYGAVAKLFFDLSHVSIMLVVLDLKVVG